MRTPAYFDRPATLLQGAHLARVVSLDDPDGLARVQVRLVAFDGGNHDAPVWARVVSALAGADRGLFFIPEIDDEVLVLFIGGDSRLPLVIGGLWNGRAQPPAAINNGVNTTKCITTTRGIRITFTDQAGQESLELETPGGQKLSLQDGPGSITLEDANGNSITLDAGGITIDAAAKVQVNAATVNVSAGAVNVDAAMAKFSGIVKCETLVATTVIATAYTPGAGNIW